MMQQNSRFTHRRLFRAKLDFALLKKNSKRNWSHFVHSSKARRPINHFRGLSSSFTADTTRDK